MNIKQDKRVKGNYHIGTDGVGILKKKGACREGTYKLT